MFSLKCSRGSRRRSSGPPQRAGLARPLGIEEDVGLSVANLLHAAHVHLRVITVDPER